MERITGHYDKVILTLIMCLVILFMATFTPFAESANAVAIVDDAIIAIIIAGLAAVGITFVTTGAFDNLADYVESLFLEYCNDNMTTPQAVLKGTQSGTDKLGRILINNRFVQLIQTFGQWLVNKYNLTNNNRIAVTNNGLSINGYTSYPLPVAIYKDIFGNGNLYEYLNEEYAVDNDIYGIPTTDSDGESLRWVFWSLSPGTITTKEINPNGNSTNLSNDYLILRSSGIYEVRGTYGHKISQIHDLDYTIQGYVGDIENSINSGHPTITREGEAIDIATDSITLPLDDADYTDGDGAIIDLDADWGLTYSDVIEQVIPDDFSDSKEGEATIEYTTEDELTEAVEDTSEITNLPSGAIPFVPLSLPQFNLVSIWHYVQQWIEDTAIAAGSVMAIATQAPHPMVNMFYAIACLAIIFGFIKGLAK